MLDGWARRRLNPFLATLAARLSRQGLTANQLTLSGFAIGISAAAAIAVQSYWIALGMILLSRLCDGLDGAVAAIKGKTDLGGYLDIVLDFAFYGLIPLGFVLADPQANAVAGAVLLLAFYANGASFLAFAVMAEKRKMTTNARGQKSLFFTTGLAEATETLLFFIAFCLFPAWFAPLAYAFAAITTYTAVSRVVIAAKTFR